MAAPLAHIFLAIQVLSGPWRGYFNEQEFIIGTSFPDIRYLKCIEREKTHTRGVTVASILQAESSFEAGRLFHSFVDERRSKYMTRKGFDKLLKDAPFAGQALKCAEDILLRKQCDGAFYSNYFDDTLPEEEEFGITKVDLKRWHVFLQKYLAGALSPHEVVRIYFDLYRPESWQITRWFCTWWYGGKVKRFIESIINNKKQKTLIEDFYTTFVDVYVNKIA